MTSHLKEAKPYFYLAAVMMGIALILGLVVQAELFKPDIQVVTSVAYNRLLILHGWYMVQGFIIPVFIGIALYKLPEIFDAETSCIPLMSRIAFWIMVLGLLFSAMYFFVIYTAVKSASELSFNAIIARLAVIVLHIGLLLNLVNIVSIIIVGCRKKLGLIRQPLLAWTYLFVSLLLIAVVTNDMYSSIITFNDEPFKISAFATPLNRFTFGVWIYSTPMIFVFSLVYVALVITIIGEAGFGRYLIGIHKILVFVFVLLFAVTWGWSLLIYQLSNQPLLPNQFLLRIETVTIISLAIYILATVLMVVVHLVKKSGQYSVQSSYLLAGFILVIVGIIIGLQLITSDGGFFLDTHVVTAYIHFIVFGSLFYLFIAAFYHWGPTWLTRKYWQRLGHFHAWKSFLLITVAFGLFNFVGKNGAPRIYADYSGVFSNYFYAITVVLFTFAIILAGFVVSIIAGYYKNKRKKT